MSETPTEELVGVTDDDPEQAQVNVKIPKRTKELAKEKLDHGGLTRVVTEELSRIAHGEKVSKREQVRDHLKKLRDKKRGKVSDRNQLADEIEQLDVKIERAEEELERLNDVQGQYDGYLQSIEERMREEEMRVFVDHGKVREAAKLGGCEQQDVINDLRQRNPGLPDELFTDGMQR